MTLVKAAFGKWQHLLPTVPACLLLKPETRRHPAMNSSLQRVDGRSIELADATPNLICLVPNSQTGNRRQPRAIPVPEITTRPLSILESIPAPDGM